MTMLFLCAFAGDIPNFGCGYAALGSLWLTSAYCSLLTAPCSLRLGGTYGRVSFRALVLHEGKKEVLALADHPLFGHARQPYSLHLGFGSRPFHLHAVLN